MAGNARYTALLDACVLYPLAMTDALMSLATAGLFAAKWSTRIEKNGSSRSKHSALTSKAGSRSGATACAMRYPTGKSMSLPGHRLFRLTNYPTLTIGMCWPPRSQVTRTAS